MTEIKLERKQSGMKWLWILIAVLLLLLLLWWLWADNDVEEPVVGDAEPVAEVEPAAEPEPLTAEPTTADRWIPIQAILENSAGWIGRDVSGEARVVEVPTDRGFWITTDDGDRLFAMIVDKPLEEPLDINAGMTLDLSEATVRSADTVQELPGRHVDDDTLRILEDLEVFLMVEESDVGRFEAVAGE